MSSPRLPFYATTVGKKVVMAVTGIIMLAFILVHMLGNLQIFAGPGGPGSEARIDAYGALLKASAPVLWGFRTILLLAVVLHIFSALQLTLKSWASRPVSYVQWKPTESTLATRSMRWGGVLIALFIVVHLLQLTTGNLFPGGRSSFVPTTVFHNMVTVFSSPFVGAFYFASMIILGLHVWHGGWSVFQTLGASHPAYNRWRRVFAVAFTLVVIGGFVSIPAAVLAGLFSR